MASSFQDSASAARPPAPTTPVEASTVSPGVLEIHLAGGARRNVFGRSTIDAVEALVSEPPDGTRVVVLTADPPDFSAGYDLEEAWRGDPEDLIANERNFALVRHATIPVVAALAGNVIGGGLELAFSADVRIAAPSARLAVPASKLGLIYSEAGIDLICSIAGQSVARAMFLGGRALSAHEAFDLGIITEVVEESQLRARAIELAGQIASWSLTASSGNRQILDVVTGRRSLDTEALRHRCFAPDGDLVASIERFVTRRSPR